MRQYVSEVSERDSMLQKLASETVCSIVSEKEAYILAIYRFDVAFDFISLDVNNSFACQVIRHSYIVPARWKAV